MTDDTTNVNYIEEMAKKFRKRDGSLDVEALARGKYEADNKYIPQLEQELTELREDLKKRETLEQVVAKIKAMKAEEASNQVTNQIENPTPNVAPQGTAVSEDTIKQLVQQSLAIEKAKLSRESNVSQVNDELTKMWGTGHQTKVNQKAQEMGVGVQFLEDLKATHPQVFLKLVSEAPQRNPDAFTAPRTSHIPLNSDGTTKNWKYWSSLRKTDPTYYHSVEGARERDRMAQLMGESFFE